jgi:hypothetical protein
VPRSRLIRFVENPRPWPFIAALLILLVLVALLRPWPARARVPAESTLYLLLALACCSVPAVRRSAAALGRLRGALLLALFVAAAAAHLTRQHGRFYPLERWTMYGSATPGVAYGRFDARLEDGSVVHFPFEEVTPSGLPRPFISHFEADLRRIRNARRDGDTAAEEAATESLSDHLVAVMAVYNRRNPGARVVAVTAARCYVNARPANRADVVSCDELVHVALPPLAAR